MTSVLASRVRIEIPFCPLRCQALLLQTDNLVVGMVRFEDGLPNPIVPEKYPRGHTVNTLNPDEEFVTVVYGESIEPLTGDINIAVVAGMVSTK